MASVLVRQLVKICLNLIPHYIYLSVICIFYSWLPTDHIARLHVLGWNFDLIWILRLRCSLCHSHRRSLLREC